MFAKWGKEVHKSTLHSAFLRLLLLWAQALPERWHHIVTGKYRYIVIELFFFLHHLSAANFATLKTVISFSPSGLMCESRFSLRTLSVFTPFPLYERGWRSTTRSSANRAAPAPTPFHWKQNKCSDFSGCHLYRIDCLSLCQALGYTLTKRCLHQRRVFSADLFDSDFRGPVWSVDALYHKYQ